MFLHGFVFCYICSQGNPFKVSEPARQSIVDSVVAELAAEFVRGPPSPVTGPMTRTRRSCIQRGTRDRLFGQYFAMEPGSKIVKGRFGKSLLEPKVAKLYREFDPHIYRMPSIMLVDREVVIGGRRWVVRNSSLGPDMGLGVFACEDIDVPSHLGAEMQYAPALFPYCGTVYTSRHWRTLVRANPSWKVYQLDMDCWPGSHKMDEHSRTIDGDPVRSANLAGYINSSWNTRPPRRANVEWVTVEGSPGPPFDGRHVDDHVMTVAILPIRAGDEILCEYQWSPMQ